MGTHRTGQRNHPTPTETDYLMILKSQWGRLGRASANHHLLGGLDNSKRFSLFCRPENVLPGSGPGVGVLLRWQTVTPPCVHLVERAKGNL